MWWRLFLTMTVGYGYDDDNGYDYDDGYDYGENTLCKRPSITPIILRSTGVQEFCSSDDTKGHAIQQTSTLLRRHDMTSLQIPPPWGRWRGLPPNLQTQKLTLLTIFHCLKCRNHIMLFTFHSLMFMFRTMMRSK